MAEPHGAERPRTMRDYSEFVPQIMEYAVDSSPDVRVSLGGREVARLSERLFIDELYVPWPDTGFEEALYRRLLNSTQLTCVAAFRGCGKTSALRHAIARIRREYPGTIQTVLVDIKQLYDAGSFAPLPGVPSPEALANAYQIFKTELRKAVQVNLLPGPELTLKFVAWLLSGPPDGSDDFGPLLVAPFVDLSNEAIAAASVGHNVRRDRQVAIAHRLRDAATFRAAYAGVVPHLSMAHVVRAAMTLDNWERVVLVFDNVDRIPAPYQVKMFEVANDAHNALSGTCATVIAIRREALRMPMRRPNDKGDPIDVLAPDNEQYPVVLFPDVRADHVNKVLQRRHAYGVLLYGTLASQTDVVRANALHTNVLSEFMRDSIHALANGSIRALTKIYSGFVRYVETVEGPALARGYDIRSDDGHLQTLFFLFLREQAREFGLLYREEVRAEADLATVRSVNDLASPHHVLMTGLFNMELNGTAAR